MYTGCAKYLHRFDELIMKPIFIYKYEKAMQKKSREFFDRLMNQGDKLEQDYRKELTDNRALMQQGLIHGGFAGGQELEDMNNTMAERIKEETKTGEEPLTSSKKIKEIIQDQHIGMNSLSQSFISKGLRKQAHSFQR